MTDPGAKKVVFYRAGTQIVQSIGKPAFLKPEGNREIASSRTIVTSDVVCYDAASGTIETLLCFYIPFKTELRE
jgi:hypothetical protein